MYNQAVLFLPSEMAATSLLITLLSLPFLLLRQLWPSSSPMPFWVRVSLMLDNAIEFPIIFAFHPSTLIYKPQQSPGFPDLGQLVLQVLVFFVIELAFQNWVLRFINISANDSSDGTRVACKGGLKTLQDKEAQNDEGIAERLVMDFLRPRGTLLLAVALLSMPTALTTYTGQLHPVAVVGWVVLQQILEFQIHQRGEGLM